MPDHTSVLVVDNASTDRTVERIRQATGPVTLIENKINKGFGRAVNQGFALGFEQEYSHFLVLNQDVTLPEDTLPKLLEIAKAPQLNPWIWISPFHLATGGRETEFYFQQNLSQRAGNFPEERVGDFLLRRVLFINAACWLIDAQNLKKMKGFDERFFMFGEDLEFCNRAVHHGFNMYLLLNVFCIHHKEKGDYENNIKKWKALQIGERMAWYLNPELSITARIVQTLRVMGVCLIWVFSGKFEKAAQKFHIYFKAWFNLLGFFGK